MRSIFSITRKKLEEYFLSIGEKKFKATQVFEWIYRKDVRSFDDMTNLSKETISKLKEDVDFNAFEYIALETDAENNEAANKFYLKNGFTLANEYQTREGRKMNEYRYRKEKDE